MNSFNEKIIYIMKIMGGPALSDATGISKTQLHRLKSEGNETTRPNLLKISEAFGCNLMWLMNNEGPMMKGDPELAPAPAPEFTNDEIEMIDLFRKAPLMLKVQTIQMLSTGQPAQTGSISVSGNENTTAGRDVN